MSTGLLDRVERAALFRFTRFLAFVVAVLLVIGFVGRLVGIVSVWNLSKMPPQWVTPAQMREHFSAASAPATTPAPANIMKGLTLPKNLNAIMFDGLSASTRAQNQQVLTDNLSELPVRDRQAYLDHMSQVVTAFAHADTQYTSMAARADVVNAYIGMMQARIAAASLLRARARRALLIDLGEAAVLLALIGLFSLVLVLLSIERNTRLAVSESRARPA